MDRSKLPEKWCIRRTPENYKIVNGWYNNKIRLSGMTASADSGYLLYPAHEMTIVTIDPPTGYVEISFEVFKKYVLEKEDDRKVLGWRLKEQYKDDASVKSAAATLGRVSALGKYDKERPYLFGIGSGVAEALEKAGVLELWFERVYKTEEKVLKLGDKATDVIVRKGSISADGKEFTLADLKQVRKSFNHITQLPWAVSLCQGVRFIKVGCMVFSLEELDDLIKEYKALNNIS